MLVQVLPRGPVEVRAPGQVSWVSDRPTPRAFPAPRLSGQWLHAGFVPDYSDGVAADSHRLPWGPHLAGRPDANDAATVADGQSGRKRGTGPIRFEEGRAGRDRLVGHGVAARPTLIDRSRRPGGASPA